MRPAKPAGAPAGGQGVFNNVQGIPADVRGRGTVYPPKLPAPGGGPGGPGTAGGRYPNPGVDNVGRSFSSLQKPNVDILQAPEKPGMSVALPPMLQAAVDAGKLTPEAAQARGVANRPRFAAAVQGAAAPPEAATGMQFSGEPMSAAQPAIRNALTGFPGVGGVDPAGGQAEAPQGPVGGAPTGLQFQSGGGLFSPGNPGVRERLRGILQNRKPGMGAPGGETTPPYVPQIPDGARPATAATWQPRGGGFAR